jgi:phospholipid/cholesterol/gamma-HCH transport system substrate-binding protein
MWWRMKRLSRLVTAAVITAVLATGCSGGGGEHTYHAVFSRAVQLFEAGDVRVLGVNVGSISDIHNVGDGVEVSFTVDDATKLPAQVHAAIVPVSLLGERYIQLYPAYQGGPTLAPGATIGTNDTSVPAEPDELLRSLQDYMGSLDKKTVSAFVENAARLLHGNGAKLNALIGHAAGVLGELAAKRADLSQIIEEFNKLSVSLSNRQQAVTDLIKAYNQVAGTLTANRDSLEGTITGLRDAALQLANLLIAHRAPLHGDVANLTATAQTLSKNVGLFANTGHWASRLFHAAQRAVAYDHRWLRLNNQGEPMGALIMTRLRQDLVSWCQDLATKVPDLPCGTPAFWSSHVPSMFCFQAVSMCAPGVNDNPVKQLVHTITTIPALAKSLLKQARSIVCRDAKYPDRCVKRKKILVQCASSDNVKQCLRKHAVMLKCLKQTATTVDACVKANENGDITKIVNGLLNNTLGGGSGGLGLP